MKYLLKYKVFEKSSLTFLGVPNEAMIDIQKQFALSSDAEWKVIKYKKDLRTDLRRNEDKLFIVVSSDKNNIIVIFSIDNEFYVDNYNFYKADDMGSEYWDKEDRIKTNVTDVNKSIPKGAKIYKLISGDWSYENSAKRELNKRSDDFDDFTIQFKIDFADNFTNIIKKLYKNHSSLIQDMIINNLLTVNNSISPEKAKEILSVNVDRAKQAKFFKNRGQEKDPYNLQIQYIRDNSITIFNEYLIRFEDGMSQEYSEFLNISELSKKYGRDKIMTAFMYYLHGGKIMKL
jgi:hypothetical protein